MDKEATAIGIDVGKHKLDVALTHVLSTIWGSCITKVQVFREILKRPYYGWKNLLSKDTLIDLIGKFVAIGMVRLPLSRQHLAPLPTHRGRGAVAKS